MEEERISEEFLSEDEGHFGEESEEEEFLSEDEGHSSPEDVLVEEEKDSDELFEETKELSLSEQDQEELFSLIEEEQIPPPTEEELVKEEHDRILLRIKSALEKEEENPRDVKVLLKQVEEIESHLPRLNMEVMERITNLCELYGL